MASSGRDFSADLARQLGFVDRSCQLFDGGARDEAIRIATPLRVMLHQTRNSTSLLTHLGAWPAVPMLSTCVDFLRGPSNRPPGMTPLFAFGLGWVVHLEERSVVVPSLGVGPVQRAVSAEEWWNEVVWILDPETMVTRRDLVLAAVNKDGGAHVDEAVPRFYERLSQGPFDAALQFTDPARSPRETHLASLRQLGFEVLNSPEILALAGRGPRSGPQAS